MTTDTLINRTLPYRDTNQPTKDMRANGSIVVFLGLMITLIKIQL